MDREPVTTTKHQDLPDGPDRVRAGTHAAKTPLVDGASPHARTPAAPERPSRIGIIVVGDLAASARPLPPAVELHVFRSGAAALRAAADPYLVASVEAVFADAALPDTSGAGCLARMASLLPDAARILLASGTDGADPYVPVGETDAWERPPDRLALVTRFLNERRALRRIRDLQRQLDALQDDATALAERYGALRRRRDELLSHVPRLVDAGAREEMECWRRDVRELELLREGAALQHLRCCTLAEVARHVDAALGSATDLLDALPAGAEHRRLWTDPARLGDVVAQVRLGFLGLGAPAHTFDLTAQWTANRLCLSCEATAGAAPEVDAWLDPLACLPGGVLAGRRPLLALADARAQALGHAPQFRRMGARLTFGLSVPPAARGDASSGARQPRRAVVDVPERAL